MSTGITRRTAIGVLAATTAAPVFARAAQPSAVAEAKWYSTQASSPWQKRQVPGMVPAKLADMFEQDATVDLAHPRQTISGIGAAFSELSWGALSYLPAADRHEALAALFSPDAAAFTLCRTPIGANDFSRKWYSYDETPDDFALKHFSIANDRETLIPFIKTAQVFRPDLKIWASPWSPPSWMKTNKYYAMTPPWPGAPDNGIRPDQVRKEGEDVFIQDDRYFDAYARYFRRYVEAYAAEGINIGMVAPQNEFNSAQPFPSCCWTPEGLSRFVPFLGREMDALGVKIFFGTLERGNADLFERFMADPKAAPFIKGVGVQWAGKRALPELARHFPNLEIWGTEWECGIGTNDWHFSRYSWDNMRRYFEYGTTAWEYWNAALVEGGKSTWGWPQNSLIVVDPHSRKWRLTHDYWLMRHLSTHVQVGARFIPVTSYLGFEDQLAFLNPDGSLVIISNNSQASGQRVRYKVGKNIIALDLPADSINTIVLPAHAVVV